MQDGFICSPWDPCFALVTIVTARDEVPVYMHRCGITLNILFFCEPVSPLERRPLSAVNRVI